MAHLRWRPSWAGLLAVILVTSPAAVAGADPVSAAPVTVAADEVALVRVQLPTEAMFHELVAAGADIASRPRSTNGEVRADIVLTGAGLSALTARGARAVQVVQRAGAGEGQGV